MGIERTAFSYYPECLGTQVGLQRADICRGLFGLAQERLKSIDDWPTVRQSLSVFSHYMNANGLDAFLKGFSKNADLVEDGNFFLSKPIAKRTFSYWHSMSVNFGHNEGRFYMDGDYGFALGFKKNRGFTFLAVVSFSNVSKVAKILRKEPVAQEAPIIVQLQGASSYTNSRDGERSLAKALLTNFRWEFIMTSLISEWARGVGLSTLYLLPWELNRCWQNKLLAPRMEMRYDVTAVRLGFTREEESGLWVVPLITLPIQDRSLNF